MDQSPPATLALNLLPAEILERLHDRAAVDRRARGAAELHLEPESIFFEEFVEHLAAQRADGEELIGARIVLEQDGGKRLRRRAGNDAAALGRIVLAVLGAAVDHRAEFVARALFLAEADEADLA